MIKITKIKVKAVSYLHHQIYAEIYNVNVYTVHNVYYTFNKIGGGLATFDGRNTKSLAGIFNSCHKF